MKILYFDLETTGVNAYKNGIWQFAFIIEINGITVEMHDFKIKPFATDEIDDEALKIGGITKEDLKHFSDNKEIFDKFKNILDKHIDKYNKNDKLYIGGYNVGFDIDFLGQWFKKNGDKYGFGVYTNWRKIDPLPILHWLDFLGTIKLENYKLETVCKYSKVKIDAHDAMSDITATIELIGRIKNKMNKF